MYNSRIVVEGEIFIKNNILKQIKNLKKNQSCLWKKKICLVWNCDFDEYHKMLEEIW